MGRGVEELRKHGYRQHQEVKWHPGSLAVIFCRHWNMFVTMFCPQQWQEEEVGWGKCHSKQRSSTARETKEEGNATRQVQEEQGQTWKIWEEDVTGTSAALTGQYMGTKQRQRSRHLDIFGWNCRYWRLVMLCYVMLSATLHPEHQQKITDLLLLY